MWSIRSTNILWRSEDTDIKKRLTYKTKNKELLHIRWNEHLLKTYFELVMTQL